MGVEKTDLFKQWKMMQDVDRVLAEVASQATSTGLDLETVRDVLVAHMKYGSPTYGEHPEQDEKIDVPILILHLPIRVKHPPPSVNTESTNVSFVQLIFPTETGSYAKYLNATIVVEGTLAKGLKGKHFTDVVMTVNTLNPAEPPVY